jgi:hypothetical protein
MRAIAIENRLLSIDVGFAVAGFGSYVCLVGPNRCPAEEI